MDPITTHIESLIFASDQPVSLKEICACLREALEAHIQEEEALSHIDTLRERYAGDHFAFELAEIAGGFQFLTKPAFHPTVGVYLKQTTRKRLSRSALETLAIIAYRQPISKSEMERIRGVSCDYAVQKLLEKELVEIKGREEGPGRPLLYGTSPKFMDYFGLKSLEDLPTPKEFKEADFAIGEKAPIEEEVAEGRGTAEEEE
ncbi:SMC-Scp complex subunit ScpB [Phaeodactylibacter luteus]|uniref:SMC-Scp complex subunit ScpB n=1 Tax=Phaeodactylibacter luteus TaxID=1564516 RepID=A0A5C6RJV1_9BACT|nr:SMC-Scp complex subunit ScpB [Phaeodactylibacter luteus]TXB62225.1 SMC-Scp complex subunit ScpB [Phaeodactylibacter luteus]